MVNKNSPTRGFLCLRVKINEKKKELINGKNFAKLWDRRRQRWGQEFNSLHSTPAARDQEWVYNRSAHTRARLMRCVVYHNRQINQTNPLSLTHRPNSTCVTHPHDVVFDQTEWKFLFIFCYFFKMKLITFFCSFSHTALCRESACAYVHKHQVSFN